MSNPSLAEINITTFLKVLFLFLRFEEPEKLASVDPMKIAVKLLYSLGFISYPRTETNILPKELNLTPLVEMQTQDQRWSGENLPFAWN